MADENDSYIDDAITQEAAIDDEAAQDYEPAPDNDAILQDDETQDPEPAPDDDAGGARHLLAESDLYNDPNNVNNMGRTAKWVVSEEHQQHTPVDGNTYGFISRADGPMLGSTCKKTIMALTWVLETAPHRKNVHRTSTLIPSFDSEDRLSGLMERKVLTNDEMDIMEGARDDIGEMRVDAIPLSRVCDFRSDYVLTGYIEKSIKLGEIFVSPVCVRYTVDEVDCSAVFWLVVLKTRRCFDFSGHVYDIVSTQVISTRISTLAFTLAWKWHGFVFLLILFTLEFTWTVSRLINIRFLHGSG